MQLLCFSMLKHMMRSAKRRRCSSVCKFRSERRSRYERCEHPGMRLVKLRWTRSSKLM